jgi:hypothetical protein
MVNPAWAGFAALRLGEKLMRPFYDRNAIAKEIRLSTTMLTQSRQAAKRHRDTSSPTPQDFKGAALG